MKDVFLQPSWHYFGQARVTAVFFCLHFICFYGIHAKRFLYGLDSSSFFGPVFLNNGPPGLLTLLRYAK